jgi:hypothetical protein
MHRHARRTSAEGPRPGLEQAAVCGRGWRHPGHPPWRSRCASSDDRDSDSKKRSVGRPMTADGTVGTLNSRIADSTPARPARAGAYIWSQSRAPSSMSRRRACPERVSPTSRTPAGSQGRSVGATPRAAVPKVGPPRRCSVESAAPRSPGKRAGVSAVLRASIKRKWGRADS